MKYIFILLSLFLAGTCLASSDYLCLTSEKVLVNEIEFKDLQSALNFYGAKANNNHLNLRVSSELQHEKLNSYMEFIRTSFYEEISLVTTELDTCELIDFQKLLENQ